MQLLSNTTSADRPFLVHKSIHVNTQAPVPAMARSVQSKPKAKRTPKHADPGNAKQSSKMLVQTT